MMKMKVGNTIGVALVTTLAFHTALQAAQHPPPLFEWARLGTGSALPRKVQIDSRGNAVLSGFLFADTTVDSIEFTNESGNGFSLVVDPTGNPVSGFQTTGNGPVQMIALPLPSGGTAYFGGMDGTVTMGSITRTRTASGGQSIFYTFADPSGEVTSFDFADGDGFDNILDAALTPQGDVVICGMFSSTQIQFGDTTLTNYASWGSYDLLIAKFSGDGQPIWVRSYPSDGDQYADRLAIDETGNIFISGTFQGAAGGTFSLGNITLTNGTGFDVFVARLTSDGDPLWARSADWGNSDWSGGISVDQSGDLFAAASAGRNSFYEQMQLTKFNDRGDVIWQFANPTNMISSARAVKIGYDGEAYVCGQYDGHGAVWKFDGRGQLEWLKSLDGAHGQTLYDLAIDTVGAITVLGYAPGTNVVVDGDVFTNPMYEDGDCPLLIARLAPDPPSLHFQQTGSDFIVSWPTNQPAFQLEANDLSLVPENWQNIPFGTVDSRFISTNSISGPGQVFRLLKSN